MTKAYSYIRFSTPQQSKGNSLERQLEASREYAISNNLDLDETLNFQDLGVSAFKGDNLFNGALGYFLEAVDRKEIQEGSYLLVENLDRLTRESIFKALTLLIDILNKGIIVVTLSDGKVYSRDDFNEQNIMYSLFIMSRGHEESVMKSKRIKSGWKAKKKNAENQPITKWVPAWLSVVDNKIVPDVERVALLRKIFQWTLDGLGSSLIIQKIEALNIEPWSASKSVKLSEKRRAKRWHASYIGKLIHNKAVMGYYENKLSDGNKQVLEGYFPRVIEPEVFYRAQSARSSRNVSAGGAGAGRLGKKKVNILKGLLRCG